MSVDCIIFFNFSVFLKNSMMVWMLVLGQEPTQNILVKLELGYKRQEFCPCISRALHTYAIESLIFFFKVVGREREQDL